MFFSPVSSIKKGRRVSFVDVKDKHEKSDEEEEEESLGGGEERQVEDSEEVSTEVESEEDNADWPAVKEEVRRTLKVADSAVAGVIIGSSWSFLAAVLRKLRLVLQYLRWRSEKDFFSFALRELANIPFCSGDIVEGDIRTPVPPHIEPIREADSSCAKGILVVLCL